MTGGSRLRPAVRVWLGLVAAHAGMWGGFAAWHPGYYETTSYDLIREVMPVRLWGVVFLLIAANAIAVLVAKTNHITALRVTLTAHFAVTTVVAWSIATLTLDGTAPGALGGAFTWLCLGFGSIAMQLERIGLNPRAT